MYSAREREGEGQGGERTEIERKRDKMQETKGDTIPNYVPYLS